MSGSRQFLIFALGETHCALAREEVSEILPLPRLWRPPGLPQPVLGFVQLGGNPVPAIALARLLGLQSDGPEDGARHDAKPDDIGVSLYKHLMLLRTESGTVALLVDRVLDVVSVAADSILPVEAQDTLNGCVEAELLIDGRLVHLLGARRVFLAEEEEKLADLRRSTEQRLAGWVQGA